MSLWTSRPMRRAVWRFPQWSRRCLALRRCLPLRTASPPAARAGTSARASTSPIPTWPVSAEAAYKSSAPFRSERDRWATGACTHTSERDFCINTQMHTLSAGRSWTDVARHLYAHTHLYKCWHGICWYIACGRNMNESKWKQMHLFIAFIFYLYLFELCF